MAKNTKLPVLPLSKTQCKHILILPNNKQKPDANSCQVAINMKLS